jgi:type I restriction enzyme M protein
MLTLTKALEDIAYRHHFSNVFDDFLKMAVCAFSYGKMEAEYERIASKYNDEEKKGFGIALAAMINDYELASCKAGSWNDVLGNVFEETNSRFTASASGQFFTPVTLCNLMAQLTCSKDEIKDNITVNDCSCGSSRNLIAHSRLHPNNRLKTFYVGQDLDERCINMSVLNFLMFGMKGYVIHMNTLTLDIYKGYRIYLPETGLGIVPLNEEQCKAVILETKKEQTVKIDLTGKQQTLF